MSVHDRPHPDAPADAGLQPERTVLSWGRTLLAVGVVGAGFLRWLPHFGWWVALLTVLAWVIAAAIHATQRRRYGRHSRGVRHESLSADPVAVLSTAAAVAGLSLAGIAIVVITRG